MQHVDLLITCDILGLGDGVKLRDRTGSGCAYNKNHLVAMCLEYGHVDLGECV